MSRVVLQVDWGTRQPAAFVKGGRGKQSEDERDVQSVLHQPLGHLLAGKRDFLALALGEAVPGVGLDGARGIVAGRGREGGGGAEGGE